MPRVLFEDATALTRRAWAVLEREKNKLGVRNLKIHTVPEFIALAEQTRLTPVQKHQILNQAQILVSNFYAHLPFKQRRFSADPVKAFEELRQQVSELSETKFHALVQLCFASVRDPHTVYIAPPPYSGAIAFLPFQTRFYTDESGRRRYIVTKVMRTSEEGGFDHKFFGPGAELVDTSVSTIEEIIQLSAQLQPGANEAGLALRGSIHVTVRPLSALNLILGPGLEPTPALSFQYIPMPEAPDQQQRGITFAWGVGTGFGAGKGFPGSAFSITESIASSRLCEKVLWRRDRMIFDLGVRNAYKPDAPQRKRKPTKLDDDHVSKLSDTFQFQSPDGIPQEGFIRPEDLIIPGPPKRRFGYVRVRTFGASLSGVGQDFMLDEFKRILGLMNKRGPDGLILDIRSNPGGQIPIAERMLQMLTPHEIRPAEFHYPKTPAVRRVLEFFKNNEAFPVKASKAGDKSEFEAWLEDLENLVEGGELTTGHPLTDPKLANNVGQIYQGPVVLLIDGLTYSAADIFAAGFQDNEIGTIIGLDESSGGGGANVWDHKDLLSFVPNLPEFVLARLPRRSGMRVAVRRCSRVGDTRRGDPIEDIGVAPDIVHRRTFDDVMFNNRDLLKKACEVLASGTAHRLSIEKFDLLPDTVLATVETGNVDSLEFLLDSQKQLTGSVMDGRGQRFSIPKVTGTPAPSVLRVNGFQNGQLVVSARAELQTEIPAFIFEIGSVV